MSAVPGSLDTDRGPPTALPLAHFLVGLGFLVAAAGLATAAHFGLAPPGLSGLATAHLLVVGWVGLTLLGAMTQFVPVWSGVPFRSRLAAGAQLPLIALGVAGLATCFALGRLALAPWPGLLVLAGLWTFVANTVLTLWRARPWDATERHFAVALVCLAAVPILGLTLALHWAGALALPTAGPDHAGLLATHRRLAVFGVVLATVLGAWPRLLAMFTHGGTDPDTTGERLLRAGEAASLPGLALLVAGTLAGIAPLARLGGLGVRIGLVAVLAFAVRRLLVARGDWGPMERRYALAVAALAAWAGLTLPNSAGVGSGAARLLLAAGVGFVVTGTLYHVVPFLTWLERYADRLGREPVPMVGDLHDGRLARLDLAGTGLGTAGLVLAGPLDLGGTAVGLAGGLVALGVAAHALAMWGVVVVHGPLAAPDLPATGSGE